MSREAMLELLDAPTEQSDLEVSGEEAGEKAIPKSKTALELDDWSLRRGEEVLEASERLTKTFQGTITDTLSAADKLSAWEKQKESAALATADFHAAAFEPSPTLAKAPENERLGQYMRQLFETPEFQSLHKETMLDETASEIAAAAFAEQWVVLVKQECSGDPFKSDMQALKAAGQALAGAKQEVSDLRDAENALGIGGNGGGRSSMKADDLAKIFKRVKGSKDLKRICELAGRYRRFAQAQQRKKVLHGKDDVVGVVLDGDIGRLLPHELAALDDPDLEMDVMRRIVERQAMCREYRGVESKARGPIVILCDESGSMSGEPLFTAKAVALALGWVAKSQNRWCCYVGFSGGTGGHFCVVPPKGETAYIDFEADAPDNHPSPDDWKPSWSRGRDGLMEWLEHNYSGGTCLNVLMEQIPAQWQQIGAPHGKTDVILISDGLVPIEETMAQNFLAWKEREKVRLISLIVNADPGDISRISDKVHRLKSLGLDEEGVAEALTV